MAAIATLRAGALLARRYRLIDPIGAGGMSIIWRARDELLDRMVAIKVLTSELASDARFRDLVREEARAAAQLVHPHVTSVHDYGEVVGNDGSITAFVVMELLSGEELEARLTGGPLPWQEAVEICAEVAEALAAAHRLGIVHRDVTPANIMVTANGAKVLDFGIATHIGAPDEDEDGDTFGTPAYVAPERLDGVPAQPATDTYSLGVLLFETLSGRVPFPAETWDDLARNRPGGQMPPLEVAGLPAAVAEICQECLSRDPRHRPSATRVGEALREQLTHTDPYSAMPSILTVPSMLSLPRSPVEASQVAVAALTGGGTATLLGGAASGSTAAPTYGVGLATAPPNDLAPGRGGLPSYPRLPTDPGTDPGPPTHPSYGQPPYRSTGPYSPTDPGRHAAPEPPPSRLVVIVRGGLMTVGSVAALGLAMLIGHALGESTEPPPAALQPTAPPAAGPTAEVPGVKAATLAPTAPPTVPAPVPTGAARGSSTLGTTGAAGASAPAPAATSLRSAPPVVVAPTFDQALTSMSSVIDEGLADGEIRRDAGLDLQTMINNLRTRPADTRGDAAQEVATLRRKVEDRTKEGAISARYGDRLQAALDKLAIAR